jgi:hypothetical protein
MDMNIAFFVMMITVVAKASHDNELKEAAVHLRKRAQQSALSAHPEKLGR